jgi:hypothetical protein
VRAFWWDCVNHQSCTESARGKKKSCAEAVIRRCRSISSLGLYTKLLTKSQAKGISQSQMSFINSYVCNRRHKKKN